MLRWEIHISVRQVCSVGMNRPNIAGGGGGTNKKKKNPTVGFDAISGACVSDLILDIMLHGDKTHTHTHIGMIEGINVRDR